MLGFHSRYLSVLILPVHFLHGRLNPSAGLPT